jgi:hypothetical protein
MYLFKKEADGPCIYCLEARSLLGHIHCQFHDQKRLEPCIVGAMRSQHLFSRLINSGKAARSHE